jgi:epoxyqueuosine reductase
MRGAFPREYRVALGDRIYGCDDCQEVCPQNETDGREVVMGEPSVSIDAMLTDDDDTLLARHGRWYIADRDPRHLRRNALIVLGNTGDGHDSRTVQLLGRYLDHPDPMLRAQAAWTARRLGRDDLLGPRAGDPAIASELAEPAPPPR